MSHLLLGFEECDTRSCVNVTVNNDMTLEKVESFFVHGNLVPLHFYISGKFDGVIQIIDDDECKNLYTVKIHHISINQMHEHMSRTTSYTISCCSN